MLCQPQLNYIQTKIVGLQKFRTWELFCEIIRQTQTKINGMMHKLSRSHIHRELRCLGHLQSMKYCLSTIGGPSADPRDPEKNKLGRWTLYSDRNLNSTFSKTKWQFWFIKNSENCFKLENENLNLNTLRCSKIHQSCFRLSKLVVFGVSSVLIKNF